MRASVCLRQGLLCTRKLSNALYYVRVHLVVLGTMVAPSTYFFMFFRSYAICKHAVGLKWIVQIALTARRACGGESECDKPEADRALARTEHISSESYDHVVVSCTIVNSVSSYVILLIQDRLLPFPDGRKLAQQETH